MIRVIIVGNTCPKCGETMIGNHCTKCFVKMVSENIDKMLEVNSHE